MGLVNIYIYMIYVCVYMCLCILYVYVLLCVCVCVCVCMKRGYNIIMSLMMCFNMICWIHYSLFYLYLLILISLLL